MSPITFKYNQMSYSCCQYLRRGDEIVKIGQLQHTAEVRRHVYCRKVTVVWLVVVKAYLMRVITESTLQRKSNTHLLFNENLC